MIDGVTPPWGSGANRPRKTPKLDQKRETEPTFRPPEAVAAEDEQLVSGVSLIKNAGGRRWAFKVNKKQGILIAGAVLLLIGSGVTALVLTRDKKPVAQAVVKAPEPKPEPPKPTTIASPLTGIQVAPELAALPVTGVMIENSPEARPQAGLKDAGVVFEAIAEGGITRFLALYQEAQPDSVGPIRSARPYYIDWLRGFDANYAHAGGSPEAIAYIRAGGIRDLDQFYNAGAYHRVSTRYAPHNLYSSLGKLIELGKGKGYATSTFTSFGRKADQPASAPTVRAIDLNPSGYLYNIRYNYDAASNSYLRSQAGKPHLDERSGAQIAPKVVVALVMSYGIQADGLHSSYQTIGSGKAYVFQDGAVTEGIWEKTASTSQIRLGDANGAPLAINAGQTWFTAVSASSKVSFTP